MDKVMEWLDVATTYVVEHFSRTEMIAFGIIAVLLALVLPSFGLLFMMALVALIFHIIVVFAIPLVEAGGDTSALDFQQMATADFWIEAGVLYLGYFLAMLILHAIKRIFYRGD
ncbi:MULTISPECIES: hypothetical protein [Euryhalocaulis]|uniref:hypothetical protein n=1 Tax=Euryhalocaulis TaxID=1712422 RepID=UPI0003A296D1|nr:MULTISPECIES: hypothetical protein [Euryhalocaulis]MBA4800340.1 hypothetical protein [Euryhalocaulis sp.]